MGDPAEKYRDQVDPEHRMAMEAIAFAFQMLEPCSPQITRFLDAERHSHAVGHILNPTLYRDQINSRSFAQQVELARAADVFIRAVRKVKMEIASPLIDRDEA